MDCATIRKLLDAYVDGEIDLITSLAVESHLQNCAACSQRVHDRQMLHTALQAHSLYFKAPDNLQQRIQNNLPQAAGFNWIRNKRKSTWLTITVALVASFVLLIGLFRFVISSDADTETLTDAVLDSHIHSLMEDHLMDVISSDQHTVKPWFDGRIDFSPIVIDLDEQGFPLLGGRLDYIDHHLVSTLVYQRQTHIINLFIWPSTAALDTATTSTTLQGYHLISWLSDQTSYWAVSDLEVSDLQAFVQLIQQQTGVP